MKIHPNHKIKLTDGSEFETRSTWERKRYFKIDIDPNLIAWTGELKKF